EARRGWGAVVAMRQSQRQSGLGGQPPGGAPCHERERRRDHRSLSKVGGRPFMTGRLAELFERCSLEMARRGLTRLADAPAAVTECSGVDPADSPFEEIRRLALDPAVEPVDCLMAAAAAGLLPARQPDDQLADDAAYKHSLLQLLERRDF